MATVLVTGANRGIGLELCRLFQERGDDVVGVCRRSSEELDGLGVRVESGVDVTEEGSVAELAKRLEGTTLDVLVNNAGVLSHERLGELDYDAIRKQFEVNSIGPLRVTEALLPRLSKGSKIAIITSRMGSIEDNSSGGAYGYRMSKAAVNAAGMSLAQDLKDKGIPVVILHPGFVKTDMTGGRGNLEPAEAAQNLIARIDELTLARTGEFRHSDGSPLPW